jgi:hypothetical protein
VPRQAKTNKSLAPIYLISQSCSDLAPRQSIIQPLGAPRWGGGPTELRSLGEPPQHKHAHARVASCYGKVALHMMNARSKLQIEIGFKQHCFQSLARSEICYPTRPRYTGLRFIPLHAAETKKSSTAPQDSFSE